MAKLAWIVAVALVVATAAPVGAIQYGREDGNAHPFVGGLVYRVGDGDPFVGCSGTLIASTVVLTAAHCAPDEEFLLLGVTFDPEYDPGDEVTDANAFEANPAYDGSDATDVAVVLLAENPGIAPAALAGPGALDALLAKARPGRPSRDLTAVGYGSTGLNRGTGIGRPDFVYPDVRMRAENRLIRLEDALAWTTAAPGTGGGTCYGDSGGPFLLGKDVVVAITISGTNPNCGGADINLRIDTEAVQAFLEQYL